MRRVLIVAGDPSGDLIAARLVVSMKKIEPDLYVTGVGGAHLKAVSDRFLEDIVSQHALGFAISPQKVFYFRHVLNQIIRPELEKNPPNVVIPVDFYGFNAQVAKLAKSLGRTVFYYVSPQFWASRPGRAEKLRRYVDMFLCLFPFEIDFYRDRQLPAKFVGHPILDIISGIRIDREPADRVESNIGLLPGSRPEEIRRHLPIMMKACRLIVETCGPARFFLFTVPHVPKDLYKDIIAKSNAGSLLVELIQEEDFTWRAQLDLAITASGMETLENTLLGIPMVVMYKMNWFTYLVAKLLIRIPYVGMPNVLSKKFVVPEFIQSRATADNIARPMINWIKNPRERQALRQHLLALREQFGETGASERAARAILEKVA